MSLGSISGKVALVTGAARRRGIGRATALRLAGEGADVACLDIAKPYAQFPDYPVATSDELEEVVAQVEAMGRRALALRADVTDSMQVDAAVAEAVEHFGHVDLCANVAGGAGFGMGAGPLLDLGDEEWERVVAVNLTGIYYVSRSCARSMVEQGIKGRIVNVSSQAGKRGIAFLGAYGAAKAGVIILTQALAVELGPSGITVNAVCPGTVDTDLLNKDGMLRQIVEAGGETFEGRLRREIPLGRMEVPEDVAAAIAWLSSDDASYVTGESLNVSGGQTMV